MAPAGPRTARAHPQSGLAPSLAAALALDAAGLVGTVRRHPAPLALAAAPIHLVALVVPLGRSLAVGVTPAAATAGMGGLVGRHLLFGLVAGVPAWVVVRPLGVLRP